MLSSTTQNSTARAPTPNPPAPAPGPVKPNYSSFSAFGAPQHATPASPPPPSLFQQQAAQPVQAPKSNIDPFAALSTPPRQSTPHQPSTTKSIFDFGQAPSPAPAAAPATAAPAATDDDDEWAFSSALPESNGLPSSTDITVTSSAILIALHASRTSPSDPAITMTVKFSSQSPQSVSELTFQVAVTKVSGPFLSYYT